MAYLKQKGFEYLKDVPIDLITSDVLDHYRTYSLIEKLLYTPTKMLEQTCFQLDQETKELFIEKYLQSYSKVESYLK